MEDDITGGDVQLGIRNIKKIAHGATTNERVTKDALIRVALEEQKRMQELFRKAEMLAEKEGRKGVKEEDVRVARELMTSSLP